MMARQEMKGWLIESQVIDDIVDEFSDAEAPFDGATVQSKQRRAPTTQRAGGGGGGGSGSGSRSAGGRRGGSRARSTLQRLPRLADLTDVLTAHGPLRIGR